MLWIHDHRPDLGVGVQGSGFRVWSVRVEVVHVLVVKQNVVLGRHVPGSGFI